MDRQARRLGSSSGRGTDRSTLRKRKRLFASDRQIASTFGLPVVFCIRRGNNFDDDVGAGSAAGRHLRLQFVGNVHEIRFELGVLVDPKRGSRRKNAASIAGSIERPYKFLS